MNLFVGLVLLLRGQDPDLPVTINHPDPKFRMTLPLGYRDAPSRPSNLSYSYQRLGPDGRGTAITVEVLDGRITPEPIPEAAARAEALNKLPPGSQFQFGKAMWGEHHLQVMESHLSMSGTELFTAVVQVPTVPRAVQLSFGGPKAFEAEIREDLRRVLGSFRGTSDWLTPRQRAMALTAGGSSMLAFGLLLVYGIVWAALFRSQPLRAWKFRVAYLSVDVALFGLAILLHVLYQIAKGKQPMDIAFYGQVVSALICATRTTQLAQKGRAAQAPPVAPRPTA